MVMDPNKLNGLNAEQKQVYFRGIADGSLSIGDQQALREKGVSEELIKELCGNNYVALDPNDSVAFTYKKRKMTEEEKGDNQKQQNKNGALALGGGALIGGIIGGILSWNPAGVAAGAAIGAGLFGATSCVNKDEYIPLKDPVDEDGEDKKTTITVIQNDNTSVNVTIIKNGMSVEDFTAIIAPYLQQILDAINKGNETTDYTELLNSILEELQQQNKELKSLSDIKVLLQALGLKSDEIKKLLEQVNKNLEELKTDVNDKLDNLHLSVGEIIKELKNNGTALADIIIALQANGVKLDEIIAAMVKNGDTLSKVYNTMVENNLDNKEILKAINTLIGETSAVGTKINQVIELLNTGITLDQNTQNLVNNVLDAVYNIKVGGGSGSSNVDTTNIEKALAVILDAITKLLTKEDFKQMNKETNAYLEAVFNLINEFKTENKAMNEKLAQLIANFANSFELFASYEKCSDEDLKKTLESFKNEVIKAIKNIKINVNGDIGGGNITVDLSEIENMMAKMLEMMSKMPTADQLDQNQKVMLERFEELTKLLNCFMTQNYADNAKIQELVANLSAAFDLFAAGEQIRDEEFQNIVANLTVLFNKLIEQGDKVHAETLNAINEVLIAVKNLKINIEGGNGNINIDLSNVEAMMAKMIEMLSNMPTKDQMTQMQKELVEKIQDVTKLLNNFMTQNKADNAKIQELVANLSAAFDLFAAGEQIRDEELKKVVENLSAFIEKFAAQENLADEKSLEAINNVLEAVKNLKIKVEGNFGGGDVTVDLSGVEAALASILAAINNLPTKDNMIQMNEDLIKSINKLTDLVNKFMANEADMDAKELELAQKILDKISNLKLEAGDVTIDLSKLEAMMAILVDKAGKLDTTTEAILEAVLNGNKDFGKALDEIKDLIIKNNNIAQGTQDLVAKLGNKIDGLGDDIKGILEKILNEEQIQNVTQAEILAVLKAVKEDTAKGNDSLLRIEEKLNLVAQTVNVLLETTKDMHEGTKALLIQILEKIPAACDCDIDAILIKLEEIITVIKENPKDSNEGIVDDLDDLLQ